MKLKFLAFAAICIIFLAGCTTVEENKDKNIYTLAELNDSKYTIAGVVGTASEPYIAKVFPNAVEKQFSKVSDIIIALDTNQVDAVVYTIGQLENVVAEKPNEVRLLDEHLAETEVHMVISPNTEIKNLRNEINEFLREKKADGTLEKMRKYWFIEHKTEMPDIPEIQNPDKKIVVGTLGISNPASFYVGGELRGFDIELVKRFAAEYGYEIEFRVEDTVSMLADAEFGKIDLISGNIMYTAERAERIIFPETPIYTIPVAVMVKNFPKAEEKNISELEDLNDAKYTIAGVVGAASEPYIGKIFPNAKEKQFTLFSDMVVALESGQADAIVFTKMQLESVLAEKPNKFKIFEKPAGETELNAAISPQTKITNLQAEMNEFLKAKKADGTLEKMYQYWLIDHKTEMPEIPEIKNPAKKLVVGTLGTSTPTSFYVGQELVGFDIEIAKRFAAEYGYEIEFRVEDIPSLLADTEFGKLDIIAGSIMYTDERAEKVIFPETPLYSMPVSVMVKNFSTADKNIFSTVQESLEKTLIREDRYKMLLDGLKVTLILSFGSIIFGTFLGLVFCILKRSHIKIISRLMNYFIALISGLPMVLTLMICFYIIFAGTGLNEVAIAIIAFSIDFGCIAAITLNSGIESVASGEIEAAESLGLSQWQIYRKIILPQAIRNIFGVYNRQIISLVKITSIVGYIAVQDLTKVSDIIRARTYDAFVSLIFTAAIYFVIARIFIYLLSFAEKTFNRRKKS